MGSPFLLSGLALHMKRFQISNSSILSSQRLGCLSIFGSDLKIVSPITIGTVVSGIKIICSVTCAAKSLYIEPSFFKTVILSLQNAKKFVYPPEIVSCISYNGILQNISFNTSRLDLTSFLKASIIFQSGVLKVLTSNEMALCLYLLEI